MSTQRGPAFAAKRVLDLIGAGLLILGLSPVMAVVAVLVKLDSAGPVFYRGTRIGRSREPFIVFKFRTMHNDADDQPHREFVQKLLKGEETTVAGMYKLTDDARVTRTGRWLRRWSIDELPQLFNVVAGDMSLVGPRPEVPYALDAYPEADHRRFDAVPGMTGLWQVAGRGNLSPRDMLELDAQYVESWCLRLDLWLLLRTVPAVLRRLGSA